MNSGSLGNAECKQPNRRSQACALNSISERFRPAASTDPSQSASLQDDLNVFRRVDFKQRADRHTNYLRSCRFAHTPQKQGKRTPAKADRANRNRCCFAVGQRKRHVQQQPKEWSFRSLPGTSPS